MSSSANEQLIRAIESDDAPAVKSAISNGADPNVRLRPDTQNYTALHLAIHRKQEAVVDELLKANDIDVNAVAKDGHTPLMSAVILYQPNIVRQLLAHPDIDVQKTDDRLRTPSQVAALNKTASGALIRALLDDRSSGDWVKRRTAQAVSAEKAGFER